MFFFNFGCLNRLGHIFLSLIIMLRHCFCFLWAFFFVLLSILFNLHSSILFGSVTTGSFVAPSILFCCCRKSEYFWMNNKRNQSGETDRERERERCLIIHWSVSRRCRSSLRNDDAVYWAQQRIYIFAFRRQNLYFRSFFLWPNWLLRFCRKSTK